MKDELFTTMPVPKAYFKLALPVVFSMVVSLVYNIVDTFFIARTENIGLIAGVSIGAPVFTLLIAIGDIFGLGGSSVISRLFGQNKDDDGKRISIFCFYGSLVCGVLVTAIMLILRTPILQMLGADQDTFHYASEYYTYLALGAPFIIVSYTPLNQLRTEGFSVASMAGSILGTFVNIILDPIFIFTLEMGAAGAAIATVAGNICTDLFFVWFIRKKSKRLSINPLEFSIKGSEIWQVLVIGIPASVTNLVQSFGIMLTNRFLLPYGNDKVAAMGIAMKVNLIAMLILIGCAFGGQPLMGYNYGSKNKARLKEIMKFSYLVECGMALVLAIGLSVSAEFLMGRFVSDNSVIQTGALMLRMQQIGMVFVAVILVTTCLFQSAGKAWQACVLSISRQGVIFFVVITGISYFYGYYGILAAQSVADILTVIVALVLLWVTFKKREP